jgi:hypothetical protein
MDISSSDGSSSAPPTRRDHTASASTGQPAKLPSYTQLAESLDGALVDSVVQSIISAAKDGFSSSAGRKRSMLAHPSEHPKKRKLWLNDEDILIIYSKDKRQLSKPSVAIVIRVQAIPEAIANAACESLDKEIARKREQGALEAGESSSVKLEWTKQTEEVVRIYEDVCASLESNSVMLQSLDGNPKGSTKWACPIVYGDVLLEKPMRYASSALGFGIIGIIALGNLDLPEIADSGPNQITSGSVAYFRDSSPIVYRASSGRGIMFYISSD